VQTIFIPIRTQRSGGGCINTYMIKLASLDELKQIVKNVPNYANLNHLDVSELDSFEGLFQYSDFNGDISKWRPKKSN